MIKTGLGVPGYQIKVVHETGEVVHTYVYHFLKQVWSKTTPILKSIEGLFIS